MRLQELVVERSQLTFNPFPLQAYIALFPVVIGLLIRTPKFILQMKEKESWSYDWVKFTAIGLPALYIVVMTFFPFSPLGEGWLPIPNFLLSGGTTIPTIAGLVFGYVVLASFKATNASNSKADF
jgi:hypothetical protein